MNLHHHRTYCKPVCLLAILLFTPLSVRSQESTDAMSTWRCLPEETVVAVRIPNGQAVADAFVQKTKFGDVIFSDQRQEALRSWLKESDPEKWSQFHKWLGEFELTADELPQFFAGECGYAVVVVPGEDDTPLPLGLAWLQPGDELARRAYDILGRVIEQQENEEHAISREDLQLADCEVMQLTLPQTSRKFTKELELPDGLDELSGKAREEAWDAAIKKRISSGKTVVRFGTAMVTAIDGRLLAVHSFKTSDDRAEHPDSEALADLLARLLNEHAGGEGESGFVAKHANDPGVVRAWDLEGVVALELIGDSAALLRLLRAAAGANEIPEKVVRMLGVESLGTFAFRSTIDGALWHSEFSLAAPQPRQGLMRLGDQVPRSSEPPSWIPANALSYQVVSFDLGKAYAVIKEEFLQAFPEQAQQYFTMTEDRVTAFAHMRIEKLLSSLGNRHTFVDYGMETSDAVSVESPSPERYAIVWQLQDEAVWSNLMQASAPMVKMMPGAEHTDEQGYSGFRYKNDLVEGGLFLGNGNLVFAYGKQVLETTLSALNSPPDGAAAFRGSDVYQKATTMLKPRPSLAFKVEDGEREVVMLRDLIVKMLEFEGPLFDEDLEGDDGKNEQRTKDLIDVLLPSDKEIKGMLGVIVTRIEVDEHGLHVKTVQEMPPPDDH